MNDLHICDKCRDPNPWPEDTTGRALWEVTHSVHLLGRDIANTLRLWRLTDWLASKMTRR